jgi:signal transduction histidine kinase
MKLANRILLFSVALIAVLMLVIVYAVEGRLYQRIIDERIAELAREGRLLAAQWARGANPASLARDASSTLGGRVTLIDSSGIIVADANLGQESAQRIGTPARRPEVAAALARSLGVSIGVSPPGQNEELFVAVRVPRGIARVAVSTQSLQSIFDAGRRDVFVAGLIAMLLASLLSIMYARYVTKPIIELRDLAHSLADRDFEPKQLSEAPGEIGELAESLQELAQRLEALERVRSEFVANVSHELRTPLTIAGGFALTLAKGDPPIEKRQQFAKSILANTRRMQRIVESLLDLSRIESGVWAPRVEQVDLPVVVGEIFEDVQDMAAEKSLEIASDLSIEGQTVNADRIAVRQIVGNLVENAIRYTASGKITVFSEHDPNGTWVGVRDTGEGISPQHLPKIFERFYRVDTARSRESGGTGLGLAVVKHLIEAHGGTISAESTPGLGTTIRVFFPGPVSRKRSPTLVARVQPARVAS